MFAAESHFYPSTGGHEAQDQGGRDGLSVGLDIFFRHIISINVYMYILYTHIPSNKYISYNYRTSLFCTSEIKERKGHVH